MEQQTARAYTPPGHIPEEQLPGRPARSRVAALKEPKAGAGVVPNDPVAGKDHIRAKAPAPKDQLVRKNAASAGGAGDAPILGSVPTELRVLQARLKQTELAWTEQSNQQRHQSEVAERRISDLASELAEATHRQAEELHESIRTVRQMKVSGIVMALLVTGLIAAWLWTPWFVAPGARFPVNAPPSSAPIIQVPPLNAEVMPRLDLPIEPVSVRPRDETLAGQSLARLDRSLARIPLGELDDVMRVANQWLVRAGAHPCTIQPDEQRHSVLVTVDPEDHAPLGAALSRCADAVEHVLN